MDTTIRSPATGGEVDILLFALDRSRAQIAWKCGGLDAVGLRRRLPPSALTLGGLLKHLALDEDHTTSRALTGLPIGPPWDAVDFDADPDWEWRTGAEDSPEELYALWQGAVERSRTALAVVLAEGGLDQPPKSGSGGWPLSIRHVLVDLHDEYARHLGQADLLREAVDGLVGEDPPQP